MLPENETVTFEDRLYVNPETSLNEQLSFVDNLRNVQNQNNAQIAQQTQNLGTDVPSNLGGLLGGSGYWTSRVQTPQTNALVADLRATAQAQALSDALKNEQAKYKQRYNKAYRDAKRRAAAGGGGDGTDPTAITGGVEENAQGGIFVPDDAVKGVSAPRAGVSDTSYYQDGNWVTVYSDGSKYVNGKKVRDATKYSGGASKNNGGGGW